MTERPSMEASEIEEKIKRDVRESAGFAHQRIDDAGNALSEGVSEVADRARQGVEQSDRVQGDRVQQAREAADRGEQGGQQALAEAEKAAHRAVNQATVQAEEMLGQVQQQASAMVSSQLGRASHNVSGVARALRAAGEELRHDEQGSLAGYMDQAAGRLEGMASYLERGDVGGMLNDVEDLARREPALFVGGALAAGLLLARFFKSSAAGQGSGQGWRENDYPIQRYQRRGGAPRRAYGGSSAGYTPRARGEDEEVL